MLITALDIQDMTRHWLSTPTNAYLGAGYGNSAKELIATPQAAGLADEFIKKLLADVPLLQTLPPGTVNVYGINTPPDRMRLVLEVAGNEFTLS
jgi:hypothetical protein